MQRSKKEVVEINFPNINFEVKKEGYRWKKCLFLLAITPCMYTICNDEITLITSKFNAMKELISRFKS